MLFAFLHFRREDVGQDLLDLLDGKKSMSVGEGHRILAAPAEA